MAGFALKLGTANVDNRTLLELRLQGFAKMKVNYDFTCIP